MSASNPWYQRYPSDELADFSILTCEEYGLFQRLRDWCWNNEGIPDSKEIFQRLARVFQLSRYKFEKLWKRLENFFTLSDGKFWPDVDEARRIKLVDISAKRKKSGILGASVRWSTRHEAIDSGVPDAIANEWQMPFSMDGKPDTPPPEPYPDPEENHHPLPPPPLANAATAGGGGDSPPLLDQEVSNIGDQPTVHEALNQRSLQLGMPAMGKTLARKIRDKFPLDWTPNQVAAALVRFSNQDSPGLWGDLTADALRVEADRQKQPQEQRDKAGKEMDKRAAEIAQARGEWG
jgi:uncharacterized protein YdaU (DUF1376 family)